LMEGETRVTHQGVHRGALAQHRRESGILVIRRSLITEYLSKLRASCLQDVFIYMSIEAEPKGDDSFFAIERS
jgi:hypothetical protein